MEQRTATIRMGIVASMAAALIGFFLPWAQLDFRTTELEKQISAGAKKSFGKVFQRGGSSGTWTKHSGKLTAIPTKVSGSHTSLGSSAR